MNQECNNFERQKKGNEGAFCKVPGVKSWERGAGVKQGVK